MRSEVDLCAAHVAVREMRGGVEVKVVGVGAGGRGRRVPVRGASIRPRFVEPRDYTGYSSGGIGDANVYTDVVGRVRHLVGALALGVKRKKHGEGGEAGGGASGVSGCPVFGAVDWRET